MRAGWVLGSALWFASCADEPADPTVGFETTWTRAEVFGLEARTLDLEGRPSRLLIADDARATVLVFIGSTCPISNRYAPTLIELAAAYAERGVEFVLVYVDPYEEVEAIREHRADYGLDMRALRDPHHALVARCGATITPEAAVLIPVASGGQAPEAWRLAYRGRIDDTWDDLTHKRPAATRSDLGAALEAVLAGRPVEPETTRAVGCLIPRAAE
jgi:thiol-disulfide isomerase/thioredoxin